MELEQVKEKYAEMTARLEELSAAAEPARKALDVAMKPYYELQDQIEQFLEEQDCHLISQCESCGTPIFEGEKHTGGEFDQCVECAPTWQDMLTNPEHFGDIDGDSLSHESAKAYCDAHVAAGGSLDDKMVF